MDKFANISRIALAVSGLALAGSIVNFTFEAQKVREDLPKILEQVDITAQRVTPLIEEINKLQTVVPQVIEQSEGYQVLIPEVLTRVDTINAQIPKLLNEIEQTRAAIPPILEEVDAWHNSLPSILKQADQTTQTVQETNRQIAGVTAIVPNVIQESEHLRKDIPVMIADAENLVANAEMAGREASKGAVSGVIGGILSSPFQLVDRISDVSSETLGLQLTDSYTSRDQNLHKQATDKLVANPKLGRKETWKNSISGNSGTVKLQSEKQVDGARCYEILSTLVIDGGIDAGTHSVVTERCVE